MLILAAYVVPMVLAWLLIVVDVIFFDDMGELTRNEKIILALETVTPVLNVLLLLALIVVVSQKLSVEFFIEHEHDLP